MVGGIGVLTEEEDTSLSVPSNEQQQQQQQQAGSSFTIASHTSAAAPSIASTGRGDLPDNRHAENHSCEVRTF